MIWLKSAILGVTGSAAVALGQVSMPSPSGAEFFTVLGSLLLITVIVRTVYGILADRRRTMESSEPKRTILPTPLDIRQIQDLATKPELQTFQIEVKEMFSEHGKQSEARIQKVHERINTIAEEMPGKVIKLLKDTGHLRWPKE